MRFVFAIAAPAAALCAMPAFAQDSGDPLDWSVALRGAYSMNDQGATTLGMTLNPEVTLTLPGRDLNTIFSAGSDLDVDATGQARFTSVRAGASTSLQLGPASLLSGNINAELSQSSPDASGLPANTAIAPLVLSANGTVSATKDLGRFDATLRLDGARRMVGETTLDDSSTIDNADQSYWQGGVALRLGYEMSPLLTVFGEGEVSAQAFDASDPSLLVFRDSRTYTLRGGVSYAWGSIISAEASAGYSWLDYVSGSLSDAPAWVYDASLTVRPDETLSLTGSLDTTLGPSSSVPADTDLAYTVGADVSYAVNPYVALRGTAAWDQTITLGTGDVGWGVSAGAGIDIRSSQQVAWTADYGYALDFTPPGPQIETHTFTAGVRYSR